MATAKELRLLKNRGITGKGPNSYTRDTPGAVKPSDIDELTHKIYEDIGSSTGYKIYKGLLVQSGEDIPTITVLENTFEDDITWQRNSVGSYAAVFPETLTAGKTVIPNDMVLSADGNLSGVITYSSFGTVVTILTYDSGGAESDDLLANAATARAIDFEVRVYE